MHRTEKWLFDTAKVAGWMASGDCNLIIINFLNIMAIRHTHLKCWHMKREIMH